MSDEVDLLLLQPVARKGPFVVGLGLFSMAAFLKDRGFRVKIASLRCDDDVCNTVEQLLELHHPPVVGVSLNWFTHSYVALEIARQVKRLKPETDVVLGGMTASLYAEEIERIVVQDALRRGAPPPVDTIVKGPGELPLLNILASRGRRGDGRITIVDGREWGNTLINDPYCYTTQNMGDIFPEWDRYLSGQKRVRVSLFGGEKPTTFTYEGEFPVAMGRGCNRNCCYCGGNRQAQRETMGYGGVLARPLENILHDIDTLVRNGVRSLFLDFDPAMDNTYLESLLDALGSVPLRCTLISWGLPTKKTLSKLSHVFEESTVTISPDNSERLRHLLYRRGLRKPSFTDEELFKAMDQMKAQGNLKVRLCYIVGLPWETPDDLAEISRLNERVIRSYSPALRDPLSESFTIFPLWLEPNSFMWRCPEDCAVEVSRKVFVDFYSFFRNIHEDGEGIGRLGVRHIGYHSEEDVIRAAEALTV